VRLYRSILFISLCFLLFCQSGLAEAVNGDPGEGRPFRVLAELAPGAPSLATGNPLLDVLGPDICLFPDALGEGAAAPAGKKQDGKGGTLLQRMSFTFSRAATKEIRIDPSRRGEEERGWEQFRSLSSSFQLESYGDSLEAMGRIFQPQVNLCIEF